MQDTPVAPELGDLNDAPSDNDGRNSFACNGVHVDNANPTTVVAENNWWGSAPPEASRFIGSVDVDPYQTSGLTGVGNSVRVTRVGLGSDLMLTWTVTGSGCVYRVMRSDAPGTGFLDVSGVLGSNSFVDVGAGDDGIDWYYRVLTE